MDDYDDYDDYDYDDGIDDAPDDWEEEQIEIEKQEHQKQAEKEAMMERKIASRAAKKAAQEVVVEEALPVEIQREADTLRQEAANVAAAAGSVGDSVEYIADMPITSPEEAAAFGSAVARHIMAQKDKDSFEAMLTELYASLSTEFTTVDSISEAFTSANVMLDKTKRQEKLRKRRGEVVVAKKKTPAVGELDMEDVDNIRGGNVEDSNDEQDW